MFDNAIVVQHLSKVYKKHLVVDDFNLTLKKGHICGLIGPNGAGKTTIMKMLAGSVIPSGGTIDFFDNIRHHEEERKRIGFLIEYPVIAHTMSAKENLEYVSKLYGCYDSEKIDQTLELIGLQDVKKKANTFSLGMKQRLGIGIALISKPEILVLDEPINGLDPEGIVEIRQLIQKLNKEQHITVLISSHILSELSELCTEFVIINGGHLIEAITKDELIAKCTNRITLKTNIVPKTITVLENQLAINNYQMTSNGEFYIFEKLDDIATISKTITDNGLTILKLVEEGQGLEEYYLQKVGGCRE